MRRLAKIYANMANSPSGEPLIDKYHKEESMPRDCYNTSWFGFVVGFKICYELMRIRLMVDSKALDEPEYQADNDRPV